MPEWPLVPIGELCELFDGPHQTAPLTDDGPVVYLNVGDIRGGRVELKLSGRVSEKTANEWSRRVEPRLGDVVFGYEAKVGEAAMLTDEFRWCLGRRVALLRPRSDRLDPRYLAYAWYSRHLQDTLRAHRIGGTTIESIRLTDVPLWTIQMPGIGEQRRIAGILGALDDRIELNRRLAATLEATARALFQSWFIDLDSPHVSGVRNWMGGSLEDFADLNPEVWASRDRPALLRYVDLSGTKWGRIGIVTNHPADGAPSRAQRILRPGDTIVGTVRPGNGSYALVLKDGLTGSTGFAQLRPKQPRDAAFVYLAATARANIDTLAHLADGGAYPAIRRPRRPRNRRVRDPMRHA